jgi:hypothetical protein
MAWEVNTARTAKERSWEVKSRCFRERQNHSSLEEPVRRAEHIVQLYARRFSSAWAKT